MATIYLRHPLHGVKPCNSVQEADADKANGWEEFDPTQPEPVVEEAPVVKPAKPSKAEKAPDLADFLSTVQPPK